MACPLHRRPRVRREISRLPASRHTPGQWSADGTLHSGTFPSNKPGPNPMLRPDIGTLLILKGYSPPTRDSFRASDQHHRIWPCP